MSLPLNKEITPGQSRKASGHLVSHSSAPVLRCCRDMTMIPQAEHPRYSLGSLKAELDHMELLSGCWQKKPQLGVGTEVLTPTGQWAESEGFVGHRWACMTGTWWVGRSQGCWWYPAMHRKAHDNKVAGSKASVELELRRPTMLNPSCTRVL